MSLVTSSEVNTLAFITPIDPLLILPEFIITAEKNYIIPVITRTVYDDIVSNPSNYTTLLDVYI
ncbi:MAG: hypothetical protein JZU67_00485, partial [Burkholderiaceae bacterium]|nr:hypothetical protein [Burkholderiaceae bacterium]